MKHFINRELLAPNVLTVPVDESIVSELEVLAKMSERDLGEEYYSLSPWQKFNDIRWISATTKDAFGLFQSTFERLDVSRHVREYLDLDREVRFYAGFLHTRRSCAELHFHLDWEKTNNEGFTLLTPVCGLKSEPSLSYRKLTGEVGEYRYRKGEAIIFGDHFIHSTTPQILDEPFTLLVFYFGSDKIQHWDKIMRTAGTQVRLIQRCDGEMIELSPATNA